jgi:hypothetical protein
MKALTLVLLLLTITMMGEEAMANCNEGLVRAQATQEIEYLRRWYAKATDKIGLADEASIEAGRAIYHRIFADAWVDLVLGVLGPMGPTQHLIGTQVVEIKSLVFNDACEVVSGSARMESYVQAWHELTDESKVWIYLGTYFDEVEFKPGQGWQIVEMKMEQMAGETRFMDEAVGGSK